MSPIGLGISRKSMVGFEGLSAHNNFGNAYPHGGLALTLAET